MTEPPKSYDVGYGKPPKQHQFKKGHQGHTAAKKKAPPTAEEIFQAEAAKQITVTIGEEKATVTKMEAMFKTMFSAALKGSARHQKMLLDYHRAIGGPDSRESSADLSEHEAAQILAIMREAMEGKG